MESASTLFIYAMAAVGFVGGIGALLVIPILLARDRKRLVEPEPGTQDETVPYEERYGRRMVHRYIGLSEQDPRNPGFVAWAGREYDEMFGGPSTAHGLHEKNRTVLGWAFIALNWMVHPPTGQPQLTPTEAAWFYRQLESSFWRVPGTRHEEPAS